jgi:hypothetical protein
MLVVALLALSVSGCGREVKTIQFVLEAESGTPTMKLGTLTVQFAELNLEKPLPGTLSSAALMVSGGKSTSSASFEKISAESDSGVKAEFDYKQSGSSGTLILTFEKPAQKTFVFEIINDGTEVRYSDKTYSLKDSPTLVIDRDGVRVNSTK